MDKQLWAYNSKRKKFQNQSTTFGEAFFAPCQQERSQYGKEGKRVH